MNPANLLTRYVRKADANLLNLLKISTDFMRVIFLWNLHFCFYLSL